MKTTLSLKVFTFSALMAVFLLGPSAVLAAVAEPGHSSPSSQPAQPAAKKKKAKVRKSLSKATLSALQPYNASSKVVPAAALNSAAGIVLSPVVNKNVVQSLAEQPPAILPTSSTSIGIAAEAVNQGYDEESSLVQHEMAPAVVTDSDALGQESVSVVDRFGDKPKAKPISDGPLRVKMKDSGVRAVVQIPLTKVLQ